jgi:hypothetical protein
MPEDVLPLQIRDRSTGPVQTSSRLIFPYAGPKQRLSVIRVCGDYTYARNILKICDKVPGVPSAMFLASEDRLEAEAEYRNAIYTVRQNNWNRNWNQFKPKHVDGTRGKSLLVWHNHHAYLKALHFTLCIHPDSFVCCSIWSRSPNVLRRPSRV